MGRNEYDEKGYLAKNLGDDNYSNTEINDEYQSRSSKYN